MAGDQCVLVLVRDGISLAEQHVWQEQSQPGAVGLGAMVRVPPEPGQEAELGLLLDGHGVFTRVRPSSQTELAGVRR